MTPYPDPTAAAINRRQFIRSISLAAGAVVGCRFQAANGDQGRFSQVLDFVNQEFKAKTFPGAALIVTQHRKTVLEKFWGGYCGREKRDVPCRCHA